MSFSYCLSVLSKRAKFLAFTNLLFFGGIFVAVVVSEWMLPPPLYLDRPRLFSRAIFGGDFFVEVFGIFVFNLGLSALAFVTLPGFAFFPLSIIVLLYRAFMWGVLLYHVPNWIFLLSMPTIILEGEGYVLAAVAGTLVGVSWIKPEWIHYEKSLSRRESLSRSLRECLAIYVFVIVLLFVGAIVEAMTLMMI